MPDKEHKYGLRIKKKPQTTNASIKYSETGNLLVASD